MEEKNEKQNQPDKEDKKEPEMAENDVLSENKEESNPSVVPAVIEDEMQKSYLDYAMSVIVSRALPDVRDGLKPVHRRILFAMNDMGIVHNKPHKKCARIVGEVLGKYHPHGDSAVYDTLVRMAQDFSLRYPLVDGQGNFGSVDGDNAAAMRYTEARMSRISEEMLADIDKETVDTVENFDGSLNEPVVLPAKFPNLLINGVSGIAVGMATNIPPHNIKEICSGVIAQIDNSDITVNELMQIVKGPDFPTGGLVAGINGIKSAYEFGRGKVIIKSKVDVEERKIIVTEIPYMVNKSNLIIQVADLVKEKRVEGISDIRDESDKRGIRIVIDLKKDTNGEFILTQLFKYTQLQVSFGINMLALVDNQPEVMGLKKINNYYIEHRKDVTIRRINYELKKAEERKHILEGLIIALNDIDSIIQKIKKSKDTQSATQMLMTDYKLSEKQSKAILDMKLQKLSSLEQEKIREENLELEKKITEFKEILSSEKRILGIIKSELNEIVEKYGDERKSIITTESISDLDINIEDLIKKEETVVVITHKGYVKRTSMSEYRSQGRGGKGIKAAKTGDDDFAEDIYVANTHDYLLVFTNKGRVYWLKVYDIPEGSRIAKGKHIINLIGIDKEEYVTSILPVKEFIDGNFLITITKKGVLKKTSLVHYSRPRKGGVIGITLDDNDEVMNVVMTDGSKQLVIATKKGLAARISEENIRPIGRTSRGVTGIRLAGGDEVVGMIRAVPGKDVLSISAKGYGKRTKLEDYRLINRGGKGVINFKITEKTGDVISIRSVEGDEELILITRNGISLRTHVSNISVIGRNTQGVRVMRLNDDDKIISSALIKLEQSEDFEEVQEISEDIKSGMESKISSVDPEDSSVDSEDQEDSDDDSSDVEDDQEDADEDLSPEDSEEDAEDRK